MITKTPDVIVPIVEKTDIKQARLDFEQYTNAYNQCFSKSAEWKGKMDIEQGKIDMYEANYVPPKEEEIINKKIK